MLFLVLFLFGCDDATKDKIKNSFDEGFRKSFKTSFVETCVKSSGKAESEPICSCMADDLLTNLSVSELTDEKKVMGYISSVAVKKCVN